MTSSKDTFSPDRVIDAVLGLLSQDFLVRTIDEPVSRALETFEYRSSKPNAYFRFIDTVSRFFEQLYINSGSISREISSDCIQQECMDLLEKRYRTPHGRGFNMAYLDAQDDIELVLLRIAGIAIDQLRERHGRWVYFRWIAGLDWKERCIFAETLFKRMPYLSVCMQPCGPNQLAEFLPEIISAIALADAKLRKVLTGEASLSESSKDPTLGFDISSIPPIDFQNFVS